MIILAFDLFILVLSLKTVCVVKELEVKLHDVILFLGNIYYIKLTLLFQQIFLCKTMAAKKDDLKNFPSNE